MTEFWIYGAGIFLILTGAIRVVAGAVAWVAPASGGQVRAAMVPWFSGLLAPAADIAAIVWAFCCCGTS